MKKLLCPKCQIPNFYLKGSGGDIMPVYITSDGVITPKRDGDTLDGYDVDTICYAEIIKRYIINENPYYDVSQLELYSNKLFAITINSKSQFANTQTKIT